MGRSKIIFGNQTLLDLTNDTVTASSMLDGVTAHGRNGELVTGNIEKEEIHTEHIYMYPLDFSFNSNGMYTISTRNWTSDINKFIEHLDMELGEFYIHVKVPADPILPVNPADTYKVEGAMWIEE